MSDTDVRQIEAAPEHAGARLDKFLSEIWPDLSRSRVKALVEEGALSAGGAALTDPAAKIRAGITYALAVPAPRAATPKPEAIPLNILYEDADLIVIDKPAGLTVHPAPGAWHGTLVNALLAHCAGSLSGIGGVERPGIVHRLDKDTSGVMVAAKTDVAHQGLSKQFAAHSVERAYIAYVRGAPRPRAGRIDSRIARSRHDRKKMAVLRNEEAESGKHAVTNYRTLALFGQIPDMPIGTPAASELECRLETGRTHQIRVHLADLGCPVLGDPTYGKQRAFRRIFTKEGEELKDFSRQALHAAILGFVHPVTGENMLFETGPPKDMQRLRKFLERL